MKVTFEDWLNNFGPRAYKVGTVRRYVTALEKAPERMGISLPKPIMEYTDPEDIALGCQALLQTALQLCC